MKWGVLPMAIKSVAVTPPATRAITKLDDARDESIKMEIEDEKEQKASAQKKVTQGQVNK